MSAEDAVYIVFAPAGLGMLAGHLFSWGDGAIACRRTGCKVGMLFLTGVSFAVLGFISRDYNSLRIPISRHLSPTLALAHHRGRPHRPAPGLWPLLGQYHRPDRRPAYCTPQGLRGRVFTVQFMLSITHRPHPADGTPPHCADLLGIPGSDSLAGDLSPVLWGVLTSFSLSVRSPRLRSASCSSDSPQ